MYVMFVIPLQQKNKLWIYNMRTTFKVLLIDNHLYLPIQADLNNY